LAGKVGDAGAVLTFADTDGVATFAGGEGTAAWAVASSAVASDGLGDDEAAADDVATAAVRLCGEHAQTNATGSTSSTNTETRRGGRR
jgi:hypothetical protein